MEEGTVLHEMLLDSEVHVQRERAEDALLKRGLDHVLKVVAGLHAAVEEVCVVVLEEVVVHLSQERPYLRGRERG